MEKGKERTAMIVPVCRLLPLLSADGPRQMASDESMLRAAEQGIASLRFYVWSTATLSLGYFQAHRLREKDSKLAIPFVRRASGGGAIVHHHELTYGLALPAGPGWHSKESWTCKMHHLITKALADFGISARSVLCGEEKKLDEFLCFLHQTPGDLLIQTHKIVGSAQRKSLGAIVQHGSILLRQSPHTPALPGIAELTGKDVGGEVLAKAITEQFAIDTGGEVEPGVWSESELRQIEELRTEKYSTSDWNHKR
jgi:lipoate-protein ligase A